MTERKCPKCRQFMKMSYQECEGRWLFRCRRNIRGGGGQKCDTEKSLFGGTFLEEHKLKPWQVLSVFYHMSYWRTYIQADIAIKV